MNRYIAKLIFSIKSDKVSDLPQFDEQFRLLFAENGEQALMKAKETGAAEEERIAAETAAVRWQFIAVEELHEVKLNDGEELFSRVHEADDEAVYLQYLYQKSKTLEERLKKESGTKMFETKSISGPFFNKLFEN